MREFGVRVALGADPWRLRSLVLRQAITLAIAGIGIGSMAALALTRLMQSLLYGVKATDSAVYLSVAAALLAVSVLAALSPARRTGRIDPMVALRSEWRLFVHQQGVGE